MPIKVPNAKLHQPQPAPRQTAAAAPPRIQRGRPHNAKRAQPYRFCGGTAVETWALHIFRRKAGTEAA